MIYAQSETINTVSIRALIHIYIYVKNLVVDVTEGGIPIWVWFGEQEAASRIKDGVKPTYSCFAVSDGECAVESNIVIIWLLFYEI